MMWLWVVMMTMMILWTIRKTISIWRQIWAWKLKMPLQICRSVLVAKTTGKLRWYVSMDVPNLRSFGIGWWCRNDQTLRWRSKRRQYLQTMLWHRRNRPMIKPSLTKDWRKVACSAACRILPWSMNPKLHSFRGPRTSPSNMLKILIVNLSIILKSFAWLVTESRITILAARCSPDKPILKAENRNESSSTKSLQISRDDSLIRFSF